MKTLNKINRLAIIPARLGSKRIKKKNIRLFFGQPIISYPIKELKNSRIFNKIFVSTESILVKKNAKKYGASVDFLRPKKLSKDSIPLNLVLKDVLLKLEKKGETIQQCYNRRFQHI